MPPQKIVKPGDNEAGLSRKQPGHCTSELFYSIIYHLTLHTQTNNDVQPFIIRIPCQDGRIAFGPNFAILSLHALAYDIEKAHIYNMC